MTAPTTTKRPFGGQRMSRREVQISKLDIDLLNPRLLVDAEDQREGVAKMLTTTGGKCMELLRDIIVAGTDETCAGYVATRRETPDEEN
ncbi:hypothetical protein ACFWGD_06875 [Corynebacterium sp. NPDC060344]|uniref:hypothetical protein n=1 Tax=Corynebacterium sp. NPDC060344 TaxID=3347101 RepID=UPI00365753CD